MKSFYSENFRLGILGGGQLGRMLIQEAIDLDVRTHVMDPAANAPCAPYAHKFVQASLMDFDAVVAFGREVDVLTIEIEHVNVDALEQLEREGVAVFPSARALRIIQDKGLQKQFYSEHHIPTAPFSLIEGKPNASQFPMVQKLRKGGYDGKGVQVLRDASDVSKAFDAPSVCEALVDFSKELSVIVSRNAHGEVATFPVVEMEFNAEANLVEFLFSPANISAEVESEAARIAVCAAEAIDLRGLLAVEMFLTKDGQLLVNEMAPRPHNSGHHTIEANVTSQYAQHLRAVLGLSPGDTAATRSAVMVNLLGEKGYEGAVKYEGLEECLAMPGVFVHLYGKAETRPFRKMGHVTVTADNLETAVGISREVQQTLKVVSFV